jgi:large subunit ribosomal protein L4
MIVVQDFAEQLARPKTKDMIQALSRWGVQESDRVLLITGEKNEMVYLSARNIDRLKLISSTNLNIYDVLLADKLVVTQSALEKIQEVYGG